MIKMPESCLAVAFALSFLCADASAQACPGAPGCLDPSFGVGGKLTIPFPPSPGAGPMDTVIFPDGKILELVYGNRFVRLNADGTLDQTFGAGGIATIPWPVVTGYGYSMRLQSVGGQPRLVVASTGGQIGRFLLNGSIDTSFGTNGTVNISAMGIPNQMEVQSDGKIVMLDNTGKIIRTNSNGSLDTGFGSGGIVVTGYLRDIAIDGTGGILVGSEVTTGKGKNETMVFAVKRFTSGGAADNGFGIGGVAVANFNVSSTRLGQVEVDPFGNILAAGGVVAPNGQYNFAAARFTANGLADTSFGGTGKVKYVGAAGGPGPGADRGVIIQADGKVVLTGALNGDYGLVRYNYNGSLDTTFGTGGSVIVNVDLQDNVGTWIMQTDPGCACSKIIMSSYGIGGPNLSFARFTIQ